MNMRLVLIIIAVVVVVAGLGLVFGPGVGTDQSVMGETPSTSQEVGNPAKQNVLACHGARDGVLLPNHPLDVNRDFTLIQSSAIALKSVNKVIRERSVTEPSLGSVPASVMALPALVSANFALIPCAALGSDRLAFCPEGESTSYLGKRQEVTYGPNDTYTAVLYIEGDSTLTAKGKIGDPGNIDLINSGGDVSVWRRSDGLESLVLDTADGLHLEVEERADCSGSLSSEAGDGTTVMATWRLFDSKNTTGSISIKSPNLNMNFDASW